MDTLNPQDRDDRIDQAVASRLAKLRTMPVDTSGLEKAMRQRMGMGRETSTWRLRLMAIRPLRAAAASVAVLFLIAAVLFYASGGPALASTAQMAQMHEDIVSGKTPVMLVDSIEQANRALAAQSPASPTLPAVPAEHVMACCMKNVKNKKVACVLLKDEGIPVTLTVANSADMRMPDSPAVSHGAMTCRLNCCDTASGKLNMVMMEKNGRWICLMGRTSTDRLMDLAGKLAL